VEKIPNVPGPVELDATTPLVEHSYPAGVDDYDADKYDFFQASSDDVDENYNDIVDAETASEADQDPQARIQELEIEKEQLVHEIKRRDEQIEALNEQLDNDRDEWVEAPPGEEAERLKSKLERAKAVIRELEEEKEQLILRLRAAEEETEKLRHELQNVRSNADRQKDELEQRARLEKMRADLREAEIEELRRQAERQISALEQTLTQTVPGPRAGQNGGGERAHTNHGRSGSFIRSQRLEGERRSRHCYVQHRPTALGRVQFG
jgi:hypothetical protein